MRTLSHLLAHIRNINRHIIHNWCTCGLTRAIAVRACVSCVNNHLEIPLMCSLKTCNHCNLGLEGYNT